MHDADVDAESRCRFDQHEERCCGEDDPRVVRGHRPRDEDEKDEVDGGRVGRADQIRDSASSDSVEGRRTIRSCIGFRPQISHGCRMLSADPGGACLRVALEAIYCRVFSCSRHFVCKRFVECVGGGSTFSRLRLRSPESSFMLSLCGTAAAWKGEGL